MNLHKMESKEHKITFSDRILAATFLRLIPKNVTPNQLTIARMISVPFVVFLILLDQLAAGIALFAVSAFTDALDGALARTRKQITEWGRTYDPVADKFLIGTVALLIIPKFLGPSIVVIIIFLEVLLIGSAYYLINKGVTKVRANAWGKAKMIFQSVGVGLLLLFPIVNLPILLIIAEYVLYGAIGLALVSLITYGI